MTISLAGPLCQSCGMPLQGEADHGTERDGRRAIDYCRFCFAKGSFTDPAIALPAMIDRCVRMMAGRGVMPEPEARAVMVKLLPGLKRWAGTAR